MGTLGVLVGAVAELGLYDGCALPDMPADNPTPTVAVVCALTSCGLGGMVASLAAGCGKVAYACFAVSAGVLVVAAVPAFELFVLVEVAAINDARGFAAATSACDVTPLTTLLYAVFTIGLCLLVASSMLVAYVC